MSRERDQPGMSDDGIPPSDDNSNGLLNSTPRPLEPRNSTSNPPEPYIARLDFDRPPEDAPLRHPSGPMMRWEAPYGCDERDDSRPYDRLSYDYRAPRDYYAEDLYYNRPYRRGESVREPPSRMDSTRETPPPPLKSNKRPEWHDSPEYESKDEHPTRQTKVEYDGVPSPPEENLRLPLTIWMRGPVKNHFVATTGEFVGTTMFLFFAFAGTQVANIGAGNNGQSSTTNQSTGFNPIVLLYVSIAFGFSLMVNVWIFFRISGGLFNPAVTLAMVMVHSIDLVRAFLLLIAQLSGAMFASFLVKVLFPTPFNVRTTLSASTSPLRGVFIEALLTAELVFTIFMLAKEKHKATFMAPIGIGLALFVAELVGVYYTGGSLNPARSFGPCVVTGQFDQEHWIYWVGPAAGAIGAVGFYRFIKILEYEMANPGQDETSEKAAASAPKKEAV